MRCCSSSSTGHRFRLKANGGDIALERSFEINVRSPNAPERRARLEQLTGPGSADLGVAINGLLPSTVRSRVSASTRVPLSIGRLVGELLEYPYGCIEQTTSKGYPYVLLDDAGAASLGMSPIPADKRQANVAFDVASRQGASTSRSRPSCRSTRCPPSTR